MEWAKVNVFGTERLFHASKDADGQNRVWEAFRSERLDNGCPITWAVWSRGYFGLGSGVQSRVPGQRVEAAFAEVGLADITGDLDVGIFVSGATRGAFKQVASRLLKIPVGSLAPEVEITSDSDLFAFKGQSRRVRTSDIRLDARDSGSAGVESADPEDVDFDFQLLIVAQGPGALRWVRFYADPKPEDISGDPDANEGDDATVNAVRFDGEAAQGDSLPEVVAALSGGPVIFEATKTRTVELAGGQLVTAGSASSVISQAAADRVALEIASRRAGLEQAKALPVVVGTKA